MSQHPSAVNGLSPDDFLNMFAGQHCFRAYWPTKGPLSTHTFPARIVGYGEHWEFEPELRRLNALGYGIYFTVNDPQGISAKKEDIKSLRCIYQECDQPDFAQIEPEIAGRHSHLVVESSPGKRHRYWLTDPLPVELFPHIQQIMRERYWHDHGAEGQQRVLRVPGYLNTQYAEKPVCRALRITPGPLLTLNQVMAHFTGDPMAGDPNTVNAMEGIQRSGDKPRAPVYDITKERAKRSGGVDLAAQSLADHKRLTNEPSANLPINDLLAVLARIDPDCDRFEKLRVLAALRWMADDEEWGEVVAESWAQLSPHHKPGKFSVLWDSLKTKHARPCHWGTLRTKAAATRPDSPEAQARRASPTFKALEAAYPLGVPYKKLSILWKDQTRPAPDQAPKPRTNSPQNARQLLEELGVTVSYDAFAKEILINDKEPLQASHLQYWQTIAHEEKWDVGMGLLDTYISSAAYDATFNEPLAWADKLIGKWDGKERIRTVGQRLLGISEIGYEGQTIELMMVAIIRRIREPGVKYDLMPIFEGDQGLGKTTFLQLLCPKPEWFAGDMRLDEEPKRLYQLMQGRLIIEFAELSGKRKTDIDKVKAFLSQQQDSFVANYDKRKTTYPRIACCAGSTNEMNYLRDTTGNRRFPPLIVTKKLDWNALLAEKEQLWAEAVWLEAMGDMFYEQLTLPDKCFRILEPVQEDRLDVDVQVLDILNELDAFETPFVQDETIWQRIGIYQDRRHERNRHRFTMDQIKNLLQRRGWKVKDVGWVDGKSKKGHFKHKKGISLREIVYANGKFMYLSTLTKEQEGILE